MLSTVYMKKVIILSICTRTCDRVFLNSYGSPGIDSKELIPSANVAWRYSGPSQHKLF